MQLAARSYLLAGFTATSIVAAVSAAPNITTHLPGVESAQVRLAAADSQLNAKMRTFRTAEANVLASLVEHTATVVGDLDVRSRGAVADRAATPGIGAAAATSSTATALVPGSSRHDAAQSVLPAPSAASLDPSDLGPLLGDVAAFNLEAIGLPFGLISALAATGDVAISDITQGLFSDLLPDVINTLNFEAGTPITRLANALNQITNEINEVDGNAPDSVSGNVSTANTGGTTAPSESNTATAPSRAASSAGPIGAFDPSAIGSLIGDTAVLGIDLVTLPAGAVVSLTDALSGAALDLGAGDIADAGKFFADTVRGGFVLAENRIANDLNTIKSHFAELTATSSPTSTAQDAAVKSTIVSADRKTAVPAPTTPQRTDTPGRTDPTKQQLSVNAAKQVTAAHDNAAASDTTAATSATSTKTPTSPKHALRDGSKTVRELTGQDDNKAAASTPTKSADQGSKTTKLGNSTHSQNHAPGGKHRK